MREVALPILSGRFRATFRLMEHRRPICEPRAQFLGTVIWLCPYCGRVADARLTPGNWRLRCKYARCRRQFTIGLTLYTMSGCTRAGRPVARPEDSVVFPRAVLKKYYSGQRVHELRETE